MKTIKIIIPIIAILLLCGCNKQVFDLDYTYDKAICNYDGEQIQIKSDDKTYLLSMNNCYLINE